MKITKTIELTSADISPNTSAQKINMGNPFFVKVRLGFKTRNRFKDGPITCYPVKKKTKLLPTVM